MKYIFFTAVPLDSKCSFQEKCHFASLRVHKSDFFFLSKLKPWVSDCLVFVGGIDNVRTWL